jgi:acyl carrier protein
MTPDAVLLTIKRILAELTSLPEAELESDDVVEDILIGDSLSRVEYFTALEREFGVDLKDANLSQSESLMSTAIHLSEVLSKDEAGV